jgi:hypothetical protein
MAGRIRGGLAFGAAAIALVAAAIALVGIGTLAPANASVETYDFSAPGYWSGTISLDVTAGVATSGTGTLDVPGYAPQELVLITPSAPGYENPAGYRANDGTDWFGIDQNVPIDGDGLLFDVGTSTPVWGGYPIFPLYASGPGTYQSGLFGHIDGGGEFWEYNINTSVSDPSAVPEASTWAMLLLGFAGLGFAGYRGSRRGSVATVAA